MRGFQHNNMHRLQNQFKKHRRQAWDNSSWWTHLCSAAIPNGTTAVDGRLCGCHCCKVSWAPASKGALLFQPGRGHGFSGSSDTTARGLGLPDGGLVCGPTPEHVLQLFPPLPLDIPTGLPLPVVHGEHPFIVISLGGLATQINTLNYHVKCEDFEQLVAVNRFSRWALVVVKTPCSRGIPGWLKKLGIKPRINKLSLQNTRRTWHWRFLRRPPTIVWISQFK